MAGLQGLLASLLNPNPGMGGLLSPGGYQQQTGLGPEQLARYHQMSGLGAPPASGAPSAPVAAPQAPMQPDQTQTASTRPAGGGIGDFLGNLLAPKSSQKNRTVQLLMEDGLDEGTATLVASNKTALGQYLSKRAFPDQVKRDTVVVDGKLVDAQTGQVIGDYGGGQKPIEINGRLVNPSTFEVMADFSDKDQSSDWSKMDDGRLFNQKTGDIKDVGQPGGGGAFEGTSVEAQSLNHLIKTGQLTPDQAAQLGAGKTITNPADGSITFLTPQGVFGMPANGGQPQPLAPQPGGDGAGTPAPGGASLRPGIIPLTEGKPGKLATEGERRNRSLYSVVEPELKIVEQNFDALSDIKNQAYSRLPLSEYATTPEFQQAANSLQTIVSSYLYSVSGATATPDEVKKQTDILTPRPGESKPSVESKKRRVRAMVDSIRQSGGQWEPEKAPTSPAEAARPDTAGSAQSFTDNKQVFDAISAGKLKVGDVIIMNGKRMRVDP